MNKLLLTAIVILGLVLSSVSLGYSGGSGTLEDPYQIATKADLLDLSATVEDYNKCFVLTADINIHDQFFTAAVIATDTNSDGGFQGTAFTGIFDGNNHKIINFTIDGNGDNYIGLFGYAGSGSSIKNLGLENFDISDLFGSTYYYAGGLVGDNRGSITNCYSMGDINSNSLFVGALVGWNRGSISNCFTTGFVSGDYYVGGLVGSSSSNGSITNCYSTATVTTNNAFDSRYMGGLVGYNTQSSISNCYATGDVNGIEYVGGLAGYTLEGDITNCYSVGAVSGTSDVGGLVGISGVVGGGTDSNSISSCYFLDTSGPDNGFGEPLTDEQMKQQASFIDWDFIEIWNIEENQTYPFLQKHSRSDIDGDGETNFYDLAILSRHWLR